MQAAAAAGVPVPPPSLSVSQRRGNSSAAALSGETDPLALASKCVRLHLHLLQALLQACVVHTVQQVWHGDVLIEVSAAVG